MKDNNTIINVEDLSKTFSLHERGSSVSAVKGVNLSVRVGALTALVGSSGAGKSTVLKCIYRSYLVSSGRLLYHTSNGDIVDLATIDERTIIKLRRGEIGFITQFLHCLPRQPAIDVVAQPIVRLGESFTRARKLAGELLARLDLPESLWNLPPATFSGGEMQRVNIARGVISKPRLLLLDEPTASIDIQTAEKVVGLINEVKNSGTAMLAIFHDPELIGALADDVVTISHSKKESLGVGS